MRAALFALFCLLAGTAWTQDLPALYRVIDVASDDNLNLRATPDGAAEIVQTLPAKADNVEVITLSDDGKWGQIGLGEVTGWAAMRYLERKADQNGPLLSRALACSGTEPFWSLEATDGTDLEFAEVGTAVVSGPYTIATSVNRTDKEGFAGHLTDSVSVTGVITRDICHDGMSDRTYGITLDLVVSWPGGNALFSGCCSLK